MPTNIEVGKRTKKKGHHVELPVFFLGKLLITNHKGCRFCLKYGQISPTRIPEEPFYFWRRIIAQRDQQTGDHTPATPDNNDTGSTADQADLRDPPLFVPVTLATPTKAEQPIELVLASSVRVRVQVGFDDDTLRQLLALLSERQEEDAQC